MNSLKLLKKIFRKKKEVKFPNEFCVVTYTDEAIQYGIFEDYTKEIRYYRGGKYTSKPYDKKILEAMEEYEIPTYDTTKGDIELPILKRISPEMVEYQDVAD